MRKLVTRKRLAGMSAVAGAWILLLLTPLAQDHEPKGITQEEAKGLVIAAAPKSMLNLRGFALDAFYIPACPDFCYFDVLWDNPLKEGSVLAGRFVVNLRTGDVWEDGLDKKVTNKRLRKMQRVLRKRIGLADSEYRKLEWIFPC